MDCTNAGCHAPQQNFKFLHGPNAVKACDACHEYTDPAKHSFQLKRPGRQLCDFCHIDKTGTEGPVSHQPFAKGECLSCHNPHGSTNRVMLKKDTVPQLCTECHKDVNSAQHIHKPAGEDCTKCHKPHTSNTEKLLVMDKRALCVSCHETVGKAYDAAAFHHEPVKGDCLQCHTPHSSNHAKELKLPPVELCASCHKEAVDKAMNAKHKHAAVTDAKACLNCHQPHASDHDKLLAKDPVASCLECHKKAIKVDKDRTVKAVGDLALENFHKHGPIQKGECAGCHTVHGGEQDKLLAAGYSTAFYQQFSEEAYGLCLKCHDKQLAITPTTPTATGFRDGERNLHYVHVVKGGPQGRSCRACHDVHTSKNDKQISEKVPFGQWEIPINFKKTETGGNCSPGCHKPEKYDRGAKPLTLTAPATTPAPPSK